MKKSLRKNCRSKTKQKRYDQIKLRGGVTKSYTLRYKKQDFRKAEVQNSENRKSRISIIENQERSRYGNKQKILLDKIKRRIFHRQNKQRTLFLMSPTHVRQEIETDIEIDKEIEGEIEKI